MDVAGKCVVITGASSGIGRAAALELAARGATVVPVGRSPDRTAEVAAAIGVEPLVADFGELGQVRALAAALLDRCPRIDVLANNAGLLVPDRRTTTDGHELTFQTNHLAPFLLTTLLLDRLRASRARVITTSSLGNRFGHVRLDDLEWTRRRYGGGWIAYSTTKLMNILFTRELARREPDVEATCFHPKPLRGKRTGEPTRFSTASRLGALVARSPLRRLALTGEDGAKPLLYLTTAPRGRSGTYFDGVRPGARVHRQADDETLATALWNASAAFVGDRP